ncbi:hypothetical protein RSJ42_09030 [Methanosarcina hadiensis]|uniref:hypothetical protein n=1 Tax=Methanosarcina hadiensis TaxID=3078083 RepID=UPI003977BA43
MLTIIILITANSTHAAPQGTVIKEGVLTYPAGPYLKEDPLLLSLENYTGDGYTEKSANLSRTPCPQKELRFLDNNSRNNGPMNLSALTPWIYPSNPFYINYKSSMEVMQSCSFSGYIPSFNKYLNCHIK